MTNNQVLAYWRDRPLLAREAFAQIEAFLRKLQATYPAFAEVYIVNRKGYGRIESDFSNLWTELTAVMNPKTRYLNNDPEDHKFSLDCRTPDGFHASFTNAGREAAQTLYVNINCGEILRPAGSWAPPSSVILTVSPEVETTELLRDLFEEIVLFWRPARASLTNPGMSDLLKQFAPGWLTYLTHPGVASALPPDIVHRPFADGVLIQAADHPGREDDPDYVRRVVHILDTLRLAEIM